MKRIAIGTPIREPQGDSRNIRTLVDLHSPQNSPFRVGQYPKPDAEAFLTAATTVMRML